ncbi:hypothetical protein AVEN_273680-1 [Araneus ventricosus]|uniref:Uncharacterized protein n=1 Tax=Araneus ventricosus TaxID=182803 RepID=A0A4Y2ML35_ARAVE|nr:hypothetical protein AVEN_273680-1 [Araneus ventricosus]
MTTPPFTLQNPPRNGFWIMGCMAWNCLPLPLISIPKTMCGVSSVGLYMPMAESFSLWQNLKAAIIEAWDNIDATVLQGLLNVMPHRVLKVIYKHGGYIGY